MVRQPLRRRLRYNNEMRPFTAPVNLARELPCLFAVMTGRHFQLIHTRSCENVLGAEARVEGRIQPPAGYATRWRMLRTTMQYGTRRP